MHALLSAHMCAVAMNRLFNVMYQTCMNSLISSVAKKDMLVEVNFGDLINETVFQKVRNTSIIRIISEQREYPIQVKFTV